MKNIHLSNNFQFTLNTADFQIALVLTALAVHVNCHRAFRVDLDLPAAEAPKPPVVGAPEQRPEQSSKHLPLRGMADNADLQVAVAAVRLRRKPESATLAGLNLCTDKINIIGVQNISEAIRLI